MPSVVRIIRTWLLAICCASSAAHAANDVASQKPEWVKQTRAPERKGLKCYLGTVSSAETREKALDQSYKTALIEVVRREFPELVKISEKSSESLRGASYNRDTVYQSDRVEFFGLSEDRESPFVEGDKEKGYDAYRVLCWPPGAVETEKLRQKAAAREQTAIPTSRINEVLPQGKSGPTGKLEITSSPPGASIVFDANMIGLTNAAFDRVVQGNYEIVFQKDGYDIKRENVAIFAGKTTKLHFKLERLKSKISVVSEPPGARIYVNNKPMNLVTPADFEEESGTDLDIKVEMDDFQTERRTTKVLDRPQEESFAMKLLPGKLSILSTPTKAEVWLDGTKMGTTPLFGKTISGGSHSLVLKKPGYADSTQEVEIRASQPQTFTVKMQLPTAAAETDSTESLVQAQTSVDAYGNTSLQQEKKSTILATGLKYVGWSGLILGTGFALLALDYQDRGDKAYGDYKSATTAADASRFRRDAESFSKKRNQSWAYAGAACGFGILSLGFGIALGD